MKYSSNVEIVLWISLSLAVRILQCSAIDNDVCSKQCVQQYYESIPKFNASSSSLFDSSQSDGLESIYTTPNYRVYSQCMTNCIADDVQLNYIYNVDTKNECHPDFAGKTGSVDLCEPADVRAEAVRVVTENDEIVEYLSISWKPCSVGILDLRGFQVIIYLDFSLGETECLSLKFDKSLKLGDEQLRFSVIYPYKLDNNGEKYSFYVLSLPRDKALEGTVHHYTAKRCPDLYPDDPCRCGFEGLDKYLRENPMNVTVTVDGYTVNIVTDELHECFLVQWIQYQIWTKDEDTDADGLHLEERETFREFRNDAKRSADIPPDGRVHYQFKPMYDLKPNITYYLRIQAVTAQKEPRNIVKKVPFNVTAWVPTLPFIKVSEQSVLVSYNEASKGYNISKYILRLHKVTRGKYVLVSNVTILQNKDGKGIGKHVFSNLKAGDYSVQVREYREDHIEESLTKVFSDTEWGPTTTFTIVLDNSYALLLTAVIVTCVMAFVVLLAVICVHFYRRDALFMTKCKPLTSESYSSPKVWLIWQADERSIELQEAHCENIRHFAAYLHTTCGFNVILDMFEKPEVYGGSYKWIQKAYKRADVIIFICPHYQQTKEKTEATIYCEVGNFDAAFRYLQSELTQHRSKFYTVALPYSELRVNDASNWLRRTSPVFNIQEDINNLYCRLRGGDNFICCTKLLTPRIDSKNSVEWNDLQHKLQRFITLQNRYLNPHHDGGSLSSSTKSLSESSDTRKVSQDEGEKGKLIPIISTNTIRHIEPPLSLDTYEETIELLDAGSSSSSSL